MSKTLTEIAEELRDANKKVQLIYAFNGTGKTRLSLELKKLIAPKLQDVEDLLEEEDVFDIGNTRSKFLYYNAFTEDLFHWDNDLKFDLKPKLEIKSNTFTKWLLLEQGLEKDINDSFQKFTGSKAEAFFAPDANSVDFIYTHPTIPEDTLPQKGQIVGRAEHIKISKGEESNFIWSVFYTLLKEVINIRNDGEVTDFDQLEYVFIDDPVSSLDDNHLIELGVSLATTIKNSRYEKNQGLRFVITTHNPLFYNVLCNELNNDLEGIKSDGSKGKVYKKKQSAKHVLKKHADGTFQLEDSNDRPFSYHLFLLDELRKLQESESVEKYHFNFLRNILEKTATFLGYKQWNKLLEKLPEDDRDVMERMLNLYSHSTHAGEEVTELKDEDKEKFIKLIKDFSHKYNFAEMKEDEDARTD